MKNINERLRELPDKNREKFEDTLADVLYSRTWCGNNGIDYSNPNISEVKEKLYNKMFPESIN